MYLCFDNPQLAAEFFRCFGGILNGKAGNSAWSRNAVSAQQFLGLIFVNFHAS
jgi:hypothetical protein